MQNLRYIGSVRLDEHSSEGMEISLGYLGAHDWFCDLIARQEINEKNCLGRKGA